MKNIYTVLLSMVTVSIFAQAPQGINYQAVVRNSSGVVIANQLVGLQLTLRQSSTNGTIVYQESQHPTTNQFGLVTVVIGAGTVSMGTFSSMNWGAGPYYIEVGADVTGGTNYTVMGTQQLMSVPYALYAERSNTPGVTGPTGPAGTNGTNGITGATGPTGIAGATGANGSNGATGSTGSVGNNGTNGVTGTAGINGTTGATGANGSTGPTGAIGATGIDGVNGATGITGATGSGGGATGPTGTAGTNGSNGINGATGPTGVAGNNGTNGTTGPAGTAGTNGPVGPTGSTGIAGTNGSTGIAGTNGANGVTGPTGITGSTGAGGGATGPTGANGNNGTIGATGPTGAGATGPTGTGVTGPTGAAGTNGATGTSGANGPIGATGATGATGNNGPTGQTGPTGAAGPNGLTGPTGIAGSNGSTGANGTSGANGSTGPTGVGVTGPTGPTGAGINIPNGNNTGDMLYWNDSAWAIVPAGTAGQNLVFCNNMPTWGGCPPVVVTNSVVVADYDSAYATGTVTNTNGNAVTARGFVWATSAYPTTANNVLTVGSGLGSFSGGISPLLSNTKYYVRAYATNDVGTAYGAQDTIFIIAGATATCISGSTVTDYDGNSYPTVSIGTQCWMASNLKVSHFNDGTSISNVTYYANNSDAWNYPQIAAWCDAYDNSSNEASYGKLYDGFVAASTTENVCPVNWHVPSTADWNILIGYLGGGSVAGGQMKTTTLWTSPNTGATDASGFSATPGGEMQINGGMYNFGYDAYFWASTNPTYPAYVTLGYNSTTVSSGTGPNGSGYAIRCVHN
jgi:uncharacterized protein (TIGR02145 family)